MRYFLNSCSIASILQKGQVRNIYIPQLFTSGMNSTFRTKQFFTLSKPDHQSWLSIILITINNKPVKIGFSLNKIFQVFQNGSSVSNASKTLTGETRWLRFFWRMLVEFVSHMLLRQKFRPEKLTKSKESLYLILLYFIFVDFHPWKFFSYGNTGSGVFKGGIKN